ncbi:MAG: amidoligase family protein, partial [bacterium]
FNDTCGIHIHCSPYDNEDWEIKDVLKVCKFYINVEEYFYDMLPQSRRIGDYAKPLENNEYFYDLVKSLPAATFNNIDNMDKQTIKDLVGSVWYNESDYRYCTGERRHNTRYVGLNIHSVFYRNTLEFRHFDGNYELLPYFIEFVDRFVDFCTKNNTSQIIDTSYTINSLEDLLNKIGVSPNTKEIFVDRAETFNAAA